MSARNWGDLLAGVFALAVVGLLVRPASLGPHLVQSLGQAMTSLVSYVADPQGGGITAVSAPTGAPAPATGGTVYA